MKCVIERLSHKGYRIGVVGVAAVVVVVVAVVGGSDAIVVAVGHKKFKAYTSDDYKNLSNGEKIIIDIKNIVENPTWRL